MIAKTWRQRRSRPLAGGESAARSADRDFRARRRGVAALDYILVLCVVFPLATFVFWAGPRIIRLAYEMVCVLVSWPFM
jgi:hypothetical protein